MILVPVGYLLGVVAIILGLCMLALTVVVMQDVNACTRRHNKWIRTFYRL